MTRTYLLWNDFETTGLDIDRDVILEAAFLLTDMRLEPVPAAVPRHYLAAIHRPMIVREEVDPLVRDMHDATSLWHDLATHDRTWTTQAMDMDVSAWLHDAMDADGHPGAQVALAGSGVGHFDQALIERHLPRLAASLTYWTMDVGVVRRYLRELVGFPIPDMLTGQEQPHRAAYDAMRALNEARVYRDMIRENVPATVEITNDRGMESLA